MNLMKNRSLMFFLSGTSLSFFGDLFLDTAFAIYLLELSGSASSLGTVFALAVIPRFLLSPLGGVLADKLDRKRLAVTLDLVRVGLLLVLWYLISQGPLSTTVIYAAVVMFAVCESFFDPVVATFMPMIVKREQLLDGNSAAHVVKRVSYVVAPVLSTLFYEYGGLKLALVVNAASFVISAFCLAMVRLSLAEVEKTEPAEAPAAPKPAAEPAGFFDDLLYGFRLLGRNRSLLSVTLNGFLSHLVLIPFFLLGFPYLILTLLQEQPFTLGVARGMAPVGEIIAGILVFQLKRHIRSEAWGIMVGLIAMAGISLLTLPMLSSDFFTQLQGHSVWISAYFGLLNFSLFFAFSFYGIFFVTFYQKIVGVKDLGKYAATFQCFIFAGQAIGFKLLGYLFDLSWPGYAVMLLLVVMAIKVVIHLPVLHDEKSGYLTFAETAR